MRTWSLAAAVLVLSAAVHAQQAQAPAPPQTPVFRGGVELLALDVTAVDADGRQVTDLAAGDFTVEVDGSRRTVATAEYIALVDEAALRDAPSRAPPPPTDEAFFSTNQRSRAGGRFILLVVDQGNIRVGAAMHVMRSAVRFVDMLAPGDYVGLVSIPAPGAHVNFTTDHEKVREGLLATTGLKPPHAGRFNISLTEAFALVEHADSALRVSLVKRECGMALSSFELTRCQLELDQEASEIVTEQRNQTRASLNGLRAVLESLAGIDAPKSIILISEGLVIERATDEVDRIAALAADVRASLDVMLLDVPPVDITQSQRPTTPREDREKQVEGLEALASVARGTLHRVPVSADAAFARINRALAGYYVLGVEAGERDRDGRRHRVTVRTSRRGVTLASRRGFLATTAPSATTTPEEAVAKALSAAVPLADMPVRLATWAYKEPGSTRVRLIVSAEVERLAGQPLDYTAGLAVVAPSGAVIAHAVEPRTLVATPLDETSATFTGVVTVEPGMYRIRVAFADSERRIASAERQVTAWQFEGPELALGDLMVGTPPQSGTMVPAAEPRVQDSLTAFLEVYAPPGGAAAPIDGVVDIVREEQGAPLLSTPMQFGDGTAPDVKLLAARVATAALPPGRYLARATVTSGGEPKGHFVRPFRVMPGRDADRASAATPAQGVPPDVRRALGNSLPAFDRNELLAPALLSSVLTSAESGRPPAVKAALAQARHGQLGPAALTALEAGDQAVAMFLKGVDLLAQGQRDRALQQLQTSMQMAPGFAPARLYLAACLADAGRHREAASLLQSVPPETAPTGATSRMAGEAWLRAGEAGLAITSLERAQEASPDDPRTLRALGMAYLLAGQWTESVTALARYLDRDPSDQAALLGATFGVYMSHQPSVRPDAIAADRTRVATWARAYAAADGPMQALVDAWKAYLDQPR